MTANAQIAATLRRLHHRLAVDCNATTNEGLDELWDILERDGVIEEGDPNKLRAPKGMKISFCADPNRSKDMADRARALYATGSGNGETGLSPLSHFGGPLLMLDDTRVQELAGSIDADQDRFVQLLLGYVIGGLTSFGPIFHLPCGFACRAKLSRFEVLKAYPTIKCRLRGVLHLANLPQLQVAGFLHFHCESGMHFGRVAKGTLDSWLDKNHNRYADLLDVI